MISFSQHPHLLQKCILTAVVMLVLIIIGYWLEHHVATIETWLSSMGHWAGAGFIVLFIILTPFLFSVDILCLIAGALFTLGPALTYVIIATMLAAALIFYIGRYLGKQQAQLLLQKHPKLTVYDRIIETNEFKVMFLLRLLPFPFALMSYVFSLTRVKFMPYWLATSGIFIYNSALVYFGYIAKHVSKQMAQGEGYTGPHTILMLGGIAGSILVIFLVAKIAREQIALLNSEDDIDMK